MTQSTRQEILDAHKALSEITYLADTYLSSISGRLDETRELRQTILDALPPKPQPTMDEVEWDDDKHYLAEAEHHYHGRVIMLSEKNGWISYFDESQRAVYDGLTSALTPTGKRYILTEVQE